VQNQKKAYLYAGLTILFWSTVATAFKFGLRYQEPFQMLAGAALSSFLFLFFWLLLTQNIKKLFKTGKRDLFYSALLGLLNPFLYYLVLFHAYDILPAQVAQPVNMIWPVVLVLISIPILKQKIGWVSIVALLISFTGVLIISSQGGGQGFSREQIPGILLCLLSTLLWSFFWIFNLKDVRDDLPKLFLNFFFALVYISIYLLIFGESFPKSGKAWFWASYAGIFEMGLSFVFWLKALRLSKTTDKVSNLIYIIPFISLFFIHFFLKEKIYYTTIYGLILIVGGIFLQNSKRNT